TAVRHAEITHVGDGGSKACGPGTHYDGASGDCVPNRARCPAGYQYDDETGNCELIDRSGDPNAWIVTIGVGTWVGAYLWPQSKTIYSVWSETSVAGGRTVYGVRISQGAPRVDRTLGVLLTSIVPHAGDRLRSDGTYILPSNLLSDQNATWPGLS